jgi:hypothetical protein
MTEKSYRDFVEKNFARFLRENFRSPAHVAVAFGVTSRTAENWLAGVNIPNGVVMCLVLTGPMAPVARPYFEAAA